MSNMNNQHIRTVKVLGVKLDVYECWTGRRPEGPYRGRNGKCDRDRYEVDHRGELLRFPKLFTEEGKPDVDTERFYDFYWNGECISLGVPLYASEVFMWDEMGLPSVGELKAHASLCWGAHSEK